MCNTGIMEKKMDTSVSGLGYRVPMITKPIPIKGLKYGIPVILGLGFRALILGSLL